VLGGGSSSPPGTMVQEMVSIVAMVCIDIRLLLHASLTERSLLDVPCSLLWVQCGLPGPLMLIRAGVFLICMLVESLVSFSVSGKVRVG